MNSAFPHASQVAQAINDYLANWTNVSGYDSPYRRAHVESLTELCSASGSPIWLAHLEPQETGMRDLAFEINNAGQAILLNEIHYSAADLHIDQAAEQIGGAK